MCPRISYLKEREDLGGRARGHDQDGGDHQDVPNPALRPHAAVDVVAQVAPLVLQDEEAGVRHRHHQQVEGRGRHGHPERHGREGPENAYVGQHRRRLVRRPVQFEPEHLRQDESADQHLDDHGREAHAQDAERKNDSSGRDSDDGGQGMGGVDGVLDAQSLGVEGVGAGDRDQARRQDERDEHGRPEVEALEAKVVPPPPPGEQGVGIEKSHVDAHGRPELPEDEGYPLARPRDVEAENPPPQLPDVDSGLEDDKPEGQNHEIEEVFQRPLESPDASPAPPPVAPAHGRRTGQEDGDDRPASDPQPGRREDVPGDRRPQGVLRELPDDRGQQDRESPEEGERRMEFFPEDVVRPGPGDERLVGDRSEHHDPQEHGQRVHPQEPVAVERAGQDRRGGRSGAEGQGALDPAGPGQGPVAPPAAQTPRPGVDSAQRRRLGVQGRGVALPDERNPPSDLTR